MREGSKHSTSKKGRVRKRGVNMCVSEVLMPLPQDKRNLPVNVFLGRGKTIQKTNSQSVPGPSLALLLVVCQGTTPPLSSSVPATVLPERLGVYTHNNTASLLAPSPTLTYRKATCHFYWRGLLATPAKGLVFSPSREIRRAAWINPCCLGHHASRISGVRWAAVCPVADISHVMWQKQRWPRAAVCRGGSNTTRCFYFAFLPSVLLTILKEKKKG